MSRKKIKKKKVTDNYTCLQCGCKFTRIRPPGPYRGLGYNKSGAKTDNEKEWVPSEIPEQKSCPVCGSSYYKWENYTETVSS